MDFDQKWVINNKMEIKIQEIKIEAEKSFNFSASHNVMTSQPKGVMAVSEARKLFNKLLELQENNN